MPPPHSHILNIRSDQEFSPFFLDVGEVPDAAEDQAADEELKDESIEEPKVTPEPSKPRDDEL